jgi:beta-lactamase class C
VRPGADGLAAQIAPPADALGAAIRLTHQACNAALASGLGWQIGNDFFYRNGLVPGYASCMAVDPTNAIGLFAFANSWGDDKGASLCAAGRNALGDLRGEPTVAGHPAAPTSTIPTCPTCPTCPT